MEHKMQKNSKTSEILAVIIVISALAIAVSTALWVTSRVERPPSPFVIRPPPEGNIPLDLQLFYTLETVFSVINVTLSIVLLILYINIYFKTRSQFTIGLIIFSAILLLNAFVSIPLLHRAFEFHEYGLGPFAFLPEMFTCVALLVLLYLTLKY